MVLCLDRLCLSSLSHSVFSFLSPFLSHFLVSSFCISHPLSLHLSSSVLIYCIPASDIWRLDTRSVIYWASGVSSQATNIQYLRRMRNYRTISSLPRRPPHSQFFLVHLSWFGSVVPLSAGNASFRFDGVQDTRVVQLKQFMVLLSRCTHVHGRPVGQGGICATPLDFGNILLNVLIILVLNNKWLLNFQNDLRKFKTY